MPLPDSIRKTLRNWPSVLVVIASAGLGLLLVTRPLEFLLTNVVPDDAFYYFQIARNIASGAGPTFDGVHPTNGFHPLWTALLVPVFHAFSTGAVPDLMPVRAALLICILFFAAASVLVFFIISRYTQNPWIRALALALFALNPFLLFEASGGLETSLALLAASGFFLAALSYPEQPRPRQMLLLGLLGGVMILARIDMAFYLAAFLLWRLAKAPSYARLREVLFTGIIATAAVSPWFLWNLSQFGMLLTSAANGNSMVSHALIVQDHGTSAFQFVKAVLYGIDYQVRSLILHTGSPAIALSLLGAALAFFALGRARIPRLAETTALHALFFGFAALFLVNVGIRLWARSWYFVTFGIFVALLFVFVAESLRPHLTRPRIVAACFALFAVYAFSVSWSKHLRDQWPTGTELYAAALWRDAHLPPDAVTGSFNAGIEGYFSRVRVVNLDGLVNNSAFEALRDRRLLSYMRDAGITVFVDYDLYLDYRYRSFFEDPQYRTHFTLLDRISFTKNERSGDGLGIYEFK